MWQPPGLFHPSVRQAVLRSDDPVHYSINQRDPSIQYTPSQLEAIGTIDEDLQMIACAGSGKTQVISARIVEILRHGVAPAHIVAFTFTEKVAGELKDRIDRLCRADLDSSQGLGDMFLGTIHGYCLNLFPSVTFAQSALGSLNRMRFCTA